MALTQLTASKRNLQSQAFEVFGGFGNFTAPAHFAWPSAFVFLFITVMLMGSSHTHAANNFDFTIAQGGGHQGNNHPRPGFRQPGSLSKSPQSDQRKNNLQGNGGFSKGINSSDAANIAKSRFGGKILRVSPSSDGHRVKLLLPSGKITYVKINANGEIQ